MHAVILIAMLLPAAPDRHDLKPMKKTLAEQVLGRWQVVAMSIGGNRDLLKEQAGTMVLNFTPTIIQAFKDGKHESNQDAAYTLDATKTPARIDLIPKQNSGPAATAHGILKLEGDQMTICIGVGGDEKRPRRFDSPPNELIVVIQFRRLQQ